MSTCHRVRTNAAAIGAVLLCAPAALADDAPALAPGARIRVETTEPVPGASGAKHFTGTLLRFDNASITVETPESEPAVELALHELKTVEISTGRNSEAERVLTGLAAGMGFGILMGLASGNDPPNQFISFTAGQKATFLAVAFAPIGALIGTLVPASEQWQSVPVDSIHLGVGTGPDGECGVYTVFRF